MLTSFEISNYKLFKTLKVESLKRINLISGMNNVGKSAFLEALHLGVGLSIEKSALPSYRGTRNESGTQLSSSVTPFEFLFNNNDVSQSIELSGILSEKSFKLKINLVNVEEIDVYSYRELLNWIERSEIYKDLWTLKLLNLHVEFEGQAESFPMLLPNLHLIQSRFIKFSKIALKPKVSFLSTNKIDNFEELGTKYSDLVKEKKEDWLIDCLKIVEPRLKSFRILNSWNRINIFGNIGFENLVPLNLMGEGILKLTSYLLEISSTKGGIVLIDEIENGFHYSVMPKVWKAIYETAKKFDVQVFATTHSRECIMAAHNEFIKMKKYDFNLMRLQEIKGKLQAYNINKEALSSAIEFEFEVR